MHPFAQWRGDDTPVSHPDSRHPHAFSLQRTHSASTVALRHSHRIPTRPMSMTVLLRHASNTGAWLRELSGPYMGHSALPTSQHPSQHSLHEEVFPSSSQNARNVECVCAQRSGAVAEPGMDSVVQAPPNPRGETQPSQQDATAAVRASRLNPA